MYSFVDFKFMPFVGIRDAILLCVKTQQLALTPVIQMFLDSDIVWQAPNVYEHRISR